MNIVVKEGNKKEMLINELDNSLFFMINQNATLVLKIAFFNHKHNVLINGKLKKNARLEIIYADFMHGINKVKANIDLLEEGARATWNLASLASSTDCKEFDISFIHHAKNTIADMQNYGVALNNAHLIFSGVNHIKKLAKKSSTNQSAKIIIFDKTSRAKANPVLKIDENDVLASHSAIVGRINDEHLFYLKSRGLSEVEAKTLIVHGYLKPITTYFNEIEQNRMNKIIEEKCHV